jgi:glycosyltransferase involved in cell wall biosynthesis
MNKKNSRTHVLLAIRQGKIGGGESHVFDLAKNLDKSKFRPIVLSFTDGPMVTNLRNIGIEVEVIYSEMPFDLTVVFRVLRILKKYSIDIVHAHGTRAASNLFIATKLFNKKIIYTVHGWSFNDSQGKVLRFLRKSAETFITRNVDLVINVSHANKKSGAKLYDNFHSRLINYGISRDKFDYSINGSDFKKQNGLSDEFVWFGLVARMTFQKDPLNLIEAFYLAQKENSKIRLVMIGEGELDEKKNNLISKYALNDKVKVLPFHQNMPEVLAAIDVYCLVSLWEGLPIGLLEAMAMKKPCIVSPADGIVEVIENEKNGIIVNKSNPEQLKNAILKLANMPELLTLFGEKAYEKIDEEFSIEMMVNKTEQVYSENS